MSNAREIARALNGKNSGNSWICCCPAHDDNSPSLSIRDGDGGRLLLHCHVGCSFAEVLAALKNLGLISGKPEQNAQVQRQNIIQKINDKLDWSAKAEYIWQLAKPINGTIVEIYLLNRGCAFPACEDIRFLPPHKDGYPSMLARITDALTGKPISLHFTYIEHDGSGKAPVERPKSLLSGHRSKGGVVRLTYDDVIANGLGLAEGIETALTCVKSGWQTVWAAGNKSNVANFPILYGIEYLTIFADHDKAGLAAAKECAKRWIEAGREVKIVTPKTPEADWNDVYQEAL